jgi:hypothetical protein
MSQGRAAKRLLFVQLCVTLNALETIGSAGSLGPIFMSIVEVTTIKAVFGWPLYATWNALAFASVQQGRQAKTLALRSFLPVLLFTATLWSALWAAAIWFVAVSVPLLAF